jgi:nucleoside-diphosphate-sugar epimerase
MGYHVVLGGHGAIGAATLQALAARGLESQSMTQKDADARDAAALARALEGASHVYHCIGLPYDSAVWEEGFPKISHALVSACERVGARLIYFDNVYLYGPPPLPVPFAEDTPCNPPSRKGAARKAAVQIVMQAHQEGRVPVTIGRAADFYGPGAIHSPFYINFLEHMLKGKSPEVIMPEGPVHTYAYTGDMGRGLVELGLDEGAYGQTFHLPVGPPVTVSQMAALFNAALGTDLKVKHLPNAIVKFVSLFNPLVREVREMNYQFKSDYILSDAKFRARFPGFEATPYETGVAAMVASFKSA